MLDANPLVTLCPQTASAFPGQPGLDVRSKDGTPLRPVFAQTATKRAEALSLSYADAALGLTLTFKFSADAATGIITAQTALDATQPVLCDWLSAPTLPGPQLADEMIDFAGRWCDEFQPVRTPWAAGIRARDNRTGRTGHEHFPALILPARGCTNTGGEAHALHYGWSGGHRMIAEELPDGRRQIQFGHASGSDPLPGTHFESAPLYVAYSDTGLNGCAVSFQRRCARGRAFRAGRRLVQGAQ
jgi:alpha-galactosidase